MNRPKVPDCMYVYYVHVVTLRSVCSKSTHPEKVWDILLKSEAKTLASEKVRNTHTHIEFLFILVGLFSSGYSAHSSSLLFKHITSKVQTYHFFFHSLLFFSLSPLSHPRETDSLCHTVPGIYHIARYTGYTVHVYVYRSYCQQWMNVLSLSLHQSTSHLQ